MRISKMVLNLTALAFVAGFAGNAFAASSSSNAVCQNRSGVERGASTNPEKPSQYKQKSQGPEKRYSRKTHKGTK